MISCFIVDDELSAVNLLRTFIAKVPSLSLIGYSTNPIEALTLLNAQSVDLIFLDIHMPHISGLEFTRLLPEKTQIILTTAYSEFAVEGFELSVLDYLLKPIAFERFLQAVQKALSPKIIKFQKNDKSDENIFIKTVGKGKWAKINLDEIIYIEGMKNYVAINTINERIVTLLNMKDLEDRLPANRFIRVHKSYIISIDKIRGIDGNQILLKGQENMVSLGDTYRTPLFEIIKQGSIND